ncbi:MAG: universal stress protein [SAR324 cluster bacterium]|nr:universal stress protein [SAR324 cluster bacterium]
MSKNIIVPIDYTLISEDVAYVADVWASHLGDGILHFLHVNPPLRHFVNPELYESAKQDVSQKALNKLTGFVETLGLNNPVEFHHVIGEPSYEIVQLANQLHPDLIVMGAHAHTEEDRFFLGSNTDFVVHHCQYPTLVYKGHEESYARVIIIPTDFQANNIPVIQLADKRAQQTGEELCFVHVERSSKFHFLQLEDGSWDYDRLDESQLQQEHTEIETRMKEFLNTLNIKSKYQFRILFGNKVYLKILDLQQELHAGMIMMASHSSTFKKLFHGSNAGYLMHHVQCPMYVHKTNS